MEDFGQATLFILAAMGFVGIAVPRLFAGVRVCVQEFHDFRTREEVRASDITDPS